MRLLPAFPPSCSQSPASGSLVRMAFISQERGQSVDMTATMQRKPDVFICHAGEQKPEMVDLMYSHLKYIHGLSVFVDEHSLRPADHARVQMQTKPRCSHSRCAVF